MTSRESWMQQISPSKATAFTPIKENGLQSIPPKTKRGLQALFFPTETALMTYTYRQ